MADPARPIRVMFLCTGNSCRSQMAEGWARALHGGVLEASSAGTAPKGIDPRAVRVMAEAGVDISGQRSKRWDSFAEAPEVVFTVCGAAHETCPVIPGVERVIHRGFDDPPRLAAGEVDGEAALGHYRRVRDEIRGWIETLPGLLEGAGVTRTKEKHS